ncbi:hypothetical protein DL95DRAFT_113396 [Leptodontidium sp. 2 PMI_412]|nr:hypothetical protein DL95DRAFT_113396 [Leptodontidium sp. 2 PMI_412]
MIVRDEYTGWLVEARPHVYVIDYFTNCLSFGSYSTLTWIRIQSMIGYYGITFDHLMPVDDADPEVLQINIMEIENDRGIYANKYSCLDIDPADYIGKKVLALPRCCQTRKGTTDQRRINGSLNRRDERP